MQTRPLSVLSPITRPVFLQPRDWLCFSFSSPLLLHLRFPGDNRLNFLGFIFLLWKKKLNDFLELFLDMTLMIGSRWANFKRIASQLELSLLVGETAQPLPLLRPIVTPTMGGLMDLRAPTSAICTLRWANVVSSVGWFLMTRWSGPGLLCLLSRGWGWFPWLELWSGKIFISTSNFLKKLCKCNPILENSTQSRPTLSSKNCNFDWTGKPQLLPWLLWLLLLPGLQLLLPFSWRHNEYC